MSSIALQEIKKRLIRIGAIQPPPQKLPISVPPRHREETLALYRSLVREAKKIKHDHHLRDFFIKRFRDGFKHNKEVMSVELLRGKLANARRELRRIQRVNEGDVVAFSRALGLAYARRGPLRHRILSKIVSQPTGTPSPPPLVPSDPRSIPPPYPPLLRHLLVNPATNPRPLTGNKVSSPPKLPERADPASEQARLLGPFSKRRERWIRWDFWTENVSRLRVPIDEINILGDETSGTGPWKVPGIQGGVSRLERFASGIGDDGQELSRGMMRRYRSLLAEVPATQWNSPLESAPEAPPVDAAELSSPARIANAKPRAPYTSSLSSLGLQRNNPMARMIAVADEQDIAWAKKELPKAKGKMR